MSFSDPVTSDENTASADVWTVGRVLTWSRQFLTEKSVEFSRYELDCLLADVLGCSRISIYLQHEKPMSTKEREKFRGYLRKFVGGEPLAYILGYADFMGTRFQVTKDVLIPRPDTEVLVLEALELGKSHETGSLLDIGLGSGCVAISLAKALPGWQVSGWDVSSNALEVAKRNAEQLSTTPNFTLTNALEDSAWGNATYDLIVSNPPYLFQGDPDVSEAVLAHEPMMALDGGKDGLEFYRLFSSKVPSALRPGGYLVMEIGWRQANAIREIFASWSICKVVPDLNGHDRVVVLQP